jgi:hypothetical protein
MSPAVVKLLSVALGAACLVGAYFTKSDVSIAGPLFAVGGGLLCFPIPAPGGKK